MAIQVIEVLVPAPIQVIEVLTDPVVSVVEVLTQGPQGPRGIQGVPGPAGQVEDYNFTQSSPDTVWVINHNLNRRVEVTPLTTGGVAILAQIIHTSLNQVQILFNTAQAGTARCV